MREESPSPSHCLVLVDVAWPNETFALAFLVLSQLFATRLAELHRLADVLAASRRNQSSANHALPADTPPELYDWYMEHREVVLAMTCITADELERCSGELARNGDHEAARCAAELLAFVTVVTDGRPGFVVRAWLMLTKTPIPDSLTDWFVT